VRPLAQWYDDTVLPRVVGEVYQAAAAKAKRNGDSATARVAGSARSTVADAARVLTDRYGVEPSHARKVLAAIATQRGIALPELAAQLTARA
jgi:hypothetical protein